MPVKNRDAHINSFWDWSCLVGCFGDSKVMPSDIDGIIEAGGHFLLIETKSPGVEIPRGQQRMFDALVKTGYFTVIVVWGYQSTPEVMQIWGKTERKPADLNDLRRVVKWWHDKLSPQSPHLSPNYSPDTTDRLVVGQ